MARDANPNHPWMYVASGTLSAIAIYDLGRSGPRKIGKVTEGLTNPSGLAVDAQGTLYAANYNNGKPGGTVTVYPAGATSPSLTLSEGLSVPIDVAVDDGGNVWVLNRGASPSIVVYPPGQTTPSQVITSSLIQQPAQLAFDPSGNAYFTDGSDVFEISNGSPVSLNLQGPGLTSGLAIDQLTGDLFVSYIHGPNEVLVYAPGNPNPKRNLRQSVQACFLSGGVMKNHQYVFVPDCGTTGNVWVFKDHANKPLRVWNFPDVGGACCIAFKPAGVP